MSTSELSEQALKEQLARILASDMFKRAGRSERLLTYLVEQTLAGRAQYLKEYTLGVDAFGRAPEFDPRSDPIARVEASRLRSKLELYYATAGKDDPLVMSLPKGSYVPEFAVRNVVPVTVAANVTASRSRSRPPWRSWLRPWQQPQLPWPSRPGCCALRPSLRARF